MVLSIELIASILLLGEADEWRFLCLQTQFATVNCIDRLEKAFIWATIALKAGFRRQGATGSYW
jgi:hypothetical protein